MGDHSDEEATENVQHIGPRLAGLEVPDGPHEWERHPLLEVELFAFTNSDGSPERPLAYVQPTAYGGGVDMTPAGLRELARQVHTHAAAIEALADHLRQLRH